MTGVQTCALPIFCHIVPITATSGEGVEQLVARAVQIAQTQCDRKDPNSFSEEVERVLQEIGEMVAPMPHIERRWQLVKVLERDGQLLEKLKLSQGVFDKLEVLITRFEQQADDDAASIIASGRYQKIDSMLRSCYKHNSLISYFLDPISFEKSTFRAGHSSSSSLS